MKVIYGVIGCIEAKEVGFCEKKFTVMFPDEEPKKLEI